MRKSQRALAAVAVIASVVAPAVLSLTPASAEIIPCYKITREPKTIDVDPVGSVTLDRVPSGVDWSDCIN